MCRVVHEINLGDKMVLVLDSRIPMQKHTCYHIDGEIYKPVPVYDAVNCIAIEKTGHYIGKKVEFV